MAKFVHIWTARESTLKQVVRAAEEADANRVREYNAAVKIQSWFRGIQLRAYVKYMNRCAVMIQKHFRGYLGRKAHLKRLRECVQEMYEKHYNKMTTRIQSAWKGYYVRKYVFNYYAYKQYMDGLARKNEIVRARLNEERERAIEERLNREERIQEIVMADEARRHHYMLSTQSRDGVLKSQQKGSFEETMKGIKFHSPSQKLTRLPSLQRDRNTVTLPPLVPKDKKQGPFRTPEEVWKQRVKPLSPTLRVSTDYRSQEIARAEVKAEEWRNRVIDEKFFPFSQRRQSYQALLHTQSSYQKPAYGTRTFREEKPITKRPFRTVVPPIPIFDKLNSTY